MKNLTCYIMEKEIVSYAKKQKIKSEELEKVAGGVSLAEKFGMLNNVEKNVTVCENCGKNFSDAEHEKTSLPPTMNIGMQNYLEANWCGDCIFEYWQKHGKGWERFKHKK